MCSTAPGGVHDEHQCSVDFVAAQRAVIEEANLLRNVKCITAIYSRMKARRMERINNHNRVSSHVRTSQSIVGDHRAKLNRITNLKQLQIITPSSATNHSRGDSSEHISFDYSGLESLKKSHAQVKLCSGPECIPALRSC